MSAIKGIKRKITAIESTQKYFQTIDLIISHFKRGSDKEKIFELVSQESTLQELFIATASVHIYHNYGLRVKNALETDQISVSTTQKLEIVEKKIFFEEIAGLLKDSFKYEIEMLSKELDLENKIISFLIEQRDSKVPEPQIASHLKDIEEGLEKDLISFVLNYPPYYFFDFVGDLLGLATEINTKILEESSEFKELSIDIERRLELEEKEDKFIELATLSRLINEIQSSFEFNSYKELQVQTMPIRMLKRKILEYNLDRFPISIPGLRMFLEANNLKLEIIKQIGENLKIKTNYDEFEANILSFLKKKIVQQLKKQPNDFLYFIECLNDNKFEETIYSLNKLGIFNLLELINIDEQILEKVKQNFTRYNINKSDLLLLNDQKKNPIFLVKRKLSEIGVQELQKIIPDFGNQENLDLIKILVSNSKESQALWSVIQKSLTLDSGTFKEFVQKKDIVEKMFLQNLNLKSYNQLLTLLEFENILQEISKDTFFYFFSRVIKQLSRIVELYLKITNERALFLLTLKKIQATTDSEEWVWVKLEELLVKRLLKRQNELVIVFNALNQPFEVNGFILARLTERSLQEGISDLQKEPSPIYEDVKLLSLKSDLISPVSYCLALDILKRFTILEQLQRLKIEQIADSKAKEEENKKKKIRDQQEGSTLNWIERKITSAMMRINSPGINPTQLYWQEKDTKIAVENMKLHSELKGNVIDLFTEYFYFSIDKIKSFVSESSLPSYDKAKEVVKETIFKVLEKRLGHVPNENELKTMLEGERLEIAKQLCTKIGKFLDKALYTKFKIKK